MALALSAHEQYQVWEGWIAADARALYFAEMCHRYQRLQKWITGLTLGFSSGALATFLGAWVPDQMAWLRPALGACAAGFSLWAFVSQNQKNATDCSDLFSRWKSLALDFESLWTSGMYAPDAANRLTALRKRDAEIGKTCNALPHKADRMLYWQEHVERHHMSYASTDRSTAPA